MAKPKRHNVQRAVKARMFDIEATVDYVMEKIDDAYEAGLEADVSDTTTEAEETAPDARASDEAEATADEDADEASLFTVE